MTSNPLNPTHIEATRKSLAEREDNLITHLGPPDERIEELYQPIPLPDNYIINAKIWRPRGKQGPPKPLILLFHGGGFHTGSPEQCTRPGREFALEFEAVVVSATYRLAPEYPWPRATLDGLEVFRWLVENAERVLGASLDAGLVVGGYSSGANVAAVIASEARGMKFTQGFTGCFLCVPLFFESEEQIPEGYRHLFTSREENDVPGMGKQAIRDAIDGAKVRTSDALFCPVYSSLGLAGLPPTYVQVGGKDSLRDDGVIYAEMLKAVGVPTRLDVHAEHGHVAWTIFTDMSAPEAETFRETTLEAMRWLLRVQRRGCWEPD